VKIEPSYDTPGKWDVFLDTEHTPAATLDLQQLIDLHHASGSVVLTELARLVAGQEQQR
jgi:hypothetical protein